MRFGGIDVGTKKSIIAIIDENLKLLRVFEFEDNNPPKVDAVGIDAPLTLPEKGNLRECERYLLRITSLYPSGAEFFKEVVDRGMQIAEIMRKQGSEVFEVYPYASRKILKIAPESKKFTTKGRKRIMQDLHKYVEFSRDLSHDEIDAVIGALTVALYYRNAATLICGKDGKILIPRKDNTLEVY